MPSRLRVVFGYAVGALVLLLARPSSGSLLVACPFALVGEGLRLWASGHIEKTQRLATGGPYGHTRNPLYLGSAMIALAVAVACASIAVAACVTLYLAAFYPSVVREEADFLRRKFGVEYDLWARDVPMFLPRLVPAGPRSTRFDWGRVRVNREWRTAAALPLVGLVLLVRGRLPL
jgi:protein-S-isoprenylcysteine O-methyltransferase Ste14